MLPEREVLSTITNLSLALSTITNLSLASTVANPETSQRNRHASSHTPLVKHIQHRVVVVVIVVVVVVVVVR